jgi:hypothetical protein
MKNLALTIIAVAGISAASFGQTEKPKLDKTPQTLKTEKGQKKTISAKKGTTVRKEVPVNK